jgi:hypothetical protein
MRITNKSDLVDKILKIHSQQSEMTDVQNAKLKAAKIRAEG